METSNTAIEPTPVTAPPPPQAQLDEPIPFQEYQTLLGSKTFQEIVGHVTNTIGTDATAAQYWNEQRALIFWWPEGNTYSIEYLKDTFGKPRATYFGLGLTMTPPGTWEEQLWNLGYRFSVTPTNEPPVPTTPRIGGSLDNANIVNDQDATRDQYEQIIFQTSVHGGPSFLNGVQISVNNGSRAANSSVFGGDVQQYTPVAADPAGNTLIAPSYLSRDIPLSGLQTILAYLGLPANTTPAVRLGNSVLNYNLSPEQRQRQKKMSHVRRLR